ncbi:hypothetical protein AB205_0163240 [Aquarana catesbeiana]|uniref:Uncharacterized protein n=1 Tax=Aquarana catesbeiana TaxID=8400 RepID=A0A2G9SG74_AQUCT|nr:hypothetical protein AB205_0163240 [Aquarana catesbeiana]
MREGPGAAKRNQRRGGSGLLCANPLHRAVPTFNQMQPLGILTAAGASCQYTVADRGLCCLAWKEACVKFLYFSQQAEWKKK